MVKVQKADGTLEDYNREKVRSSLQRAGADPKLIQLIIDHVEKELYEGIPTDEIYNHIFDLLRGRSHPLSVRYNLKRAIMELGPSGYPFEKFFAGVLSHYGYETELNVIASGKCISHELDVLAKKDGKIITIECKFHNRTGTKSDVRSALYVHARYLDLQQNGNYDEHWLVTNTKATSDAITYAQCVGLKIISWNYPEGFSLRELVETSNLHPITALDSLNQDEKHKLLEEGVVFMKDYDKRHE